MLRRALCWLGIRRLATAILFVGIFTMAARPPVGPDTWWHLQAGRVTLERGRILQTDLFSHTRYGTHWVNHSWLSQIVLFWLFDRFSYAGLALCMAALVTATFALVYWQMEGGALTRAFILVLAAATAAVIWSARPQLFSFLLTAAVAYVLYLFKWRGVNRLWLLPPLFVLWVNLHAGYALGFMVLAAFVAGEVLNHLLASFIPAEDLMVSWQGIGLVIGVSVLSFLLLVVNPNTTRMWTYYLDTVRIDVLQDFILEWRPPDFHLLRMHPFIWLLLGTLAAIGLSRRRLDGTDLVTLGLFGYAALLAARNVAPFALLAAPVLGRHLTSMGASQDPGGDQPWRPHPRPASPLWATLNWALLMVVVALAGFQIHRVVRPEHNAALQQETMPVDAVRWIEEQRPEGEIFNHYNWGGYLIWRLWPDYRVFVDGRTDLYGDDLLRRYLTVQTARPGFERILADHDVNLIFIPTESVLSTQLACQDGWTSAYRDDLAIVWLRQSDRQ